jgi:tetratricopeptide (TPR) repeat protein
VEAYVGEGNALIGDMRLADAVRAFERGFLMDSSNVDVLLAYGAGLLQVGRVQEGLAQLRRARERDPLSATVVGLLGYAFELLRQYDAAIATTKAAIDLDSGNVLAHQGLGFLFAFNNMPDSAVRQLETAFSLDSTLFGGRSNLVFGYAVAGRWTDASRQRALLEREVGGNSPNYYRMVAHLAFGEYDAAMGALERSAAAREPLLGLPSIGCDPIFDPLKPDPRLSALVQRLGARTCSAVSKWPIAPRPH